MRQVDVAVIGAGYGGLGAALRLAEAGASVLIAEALSYPGGCASSFVRHGRRYDAGATLLSGLGPGQLFERWISRHGLPVRATPLDPTIVLRAPGLCLPVPPDRDRFLAALLALPGVPRAPTLAFFTEQARVSDALWRLLDTPERLPRTLGDLPRLLRHAPGLLPVARWVGKPLLAVLRRHGVAEVQPLRIWLDAVCQITVQASAAEAEAPFALAAMDYAFRGAAHVSGGVGVLAEALLGAVRGLGGQVALASRVRALARVGDAWRLDVRGEPVLARRVVANLLPQAVAALVGPTPALTDLGRRVASGWGAVMLYRALAPDDRLPEAPFHWELVVDPSRPYTEGNHLFCSVGPVEQGGRSMTVSTHVPNLDGLPDAEIAARIARIQQAMRDGLALRAPELDQATRAEMTASPRTFSRFVRRPMGLVGGIPRRAGLQSYALSTALPRPVLPGLYLVGDTVFPGQSALARALGGCRVADVILREVEPPRLLEAS